MASAEQKTNLEEIQARLKVFAEEISTNLSQLDSAQRKEILGVFVSELIVSVTEQERKEIRRQRQAEGIATARAQGVRFGRAPKPLPDNFIQYYKAWQDKQMTAAEAAEACGISRAAFYNTAYRVKRSKECPV